MNKKLSIKDIKEISLSTKHIMSPITSKSTSKSKKLDRVYLTELKARSLFRKK